MKRTPLRRRTPLKRGGRIRSRAPRRTLGETLVLMAHFGTNPKCTRCGEPASDLHHVKPKSAGGTDVLSNIAATCRKCHRWVHDHPDEAHAEGLLLRSWDVEPVSEES